MTVSVKTQFLKTSGTVVDFQAVPPAFFHDWISMGEIEMVGRPRDVVYAEGRRGEPKVEVYRPHYVARAAQVIERYSR
jgi:hypothetical protein